MRLSFGLSLALSLSILLLPYSKSAPLAPLQPSSARSRVRESCISIFFRWSKRGPFGSRSRIPATFPFPGPLCPFLSDGEPGGRAAPRANPLLKTHTRAVPDSFRTMARILAFLLPPCSLSLFLLFCYPHPFLFIPLLVTSYEALDAYPPSRPCTSDASSLLQPPCDAILRSSKMPLTDKETHVEIWKCKSLEFILICVVLRRFI